jgi:hypothetical protein
MLLLRSHVAAELSAGKARLRTRLAMIMIMLFAFSAAGFTNIGAKCANFFHKGAVRLHGFHCQRANIRTFPVKPDAAAQIVVCTFCQTFCETMVASFHTCDTSFNGLLHA